jgi:hypothetical protein
MNSATASAAPPRVEELLSDGEDTEDDRYAHAQQSNSLLPPHSHGNGYNGQPLPHPAVPFSDPAAGYSGASFEDAIELSD